MGYWKDKMIKDQQRGWSSPGDKYVCPKCFDDYALASFVKDNASEKKCDYCGRTSKGKPIAAPIDDVMAEISKGIRSEWGHPDDVGVPYESAEGGYQGDVMPTRDLINDELGDVFVSESLREDIIEAFDSQGAMWCDQHFWSLPPNEALRYGWEHFERFVKHSVRYLFLSAPDHESEYRGYEEVPPNQFLDRLGEVAKDVGLATILSQGSKIFRARVHKRGETPRSADELGPPPEEKAISNRMSPVGIPMFYGAFDEITAVKEVCYSSSRNEVLVTTGIFETARDFLVLDLTRLPKIPSMFDSARRDTRPEIMFLDDFTEDLGKQIKKDGREHLEYIPTQIVTEFFRHIYVSSESEFLKGILYPSAQNKGGKCCVLFFRSEDCCDIITGWQSATKEFMPDVQRYWLGLNPSSITVVDRYRSKT